jgi:hypothetical protein
MVFAGGRRLKTSLVYRVLENEYAKFGFNPIDNSLARSDLRFFRWLQRIQIFKSTAIYSESNLYYN